MAKMIPVVETSTGGIDYNGTNYFIWAWECNILRRLEEVKSRLRRRSSIVAWAFYRHLALECEVEGSKYRYRDNPAIAALEKKALKLEDAQERWLAGRST